MRQRAAELTDDIVAVYNDGERALNLRARLRIEGRTLYIYDNSENELSSWPLREVRDVTPEGVVQSLRVERRGTNEKLTITNPEWRQEIRSRVGYGPAAAGGGAIAHGGEEEPRRRRGGMRILVTLVVLLAVVGALFFVAVPMFAAPIAAQIPTAWEQDIGARMAQAMLSPKRASVKGSSTAAQAAAPQATPALRVCESAGGSAALAQIVSRIGDAASPSVALNVRVLDDARIDTVALPGGNIMIFRGLINAVQSPEELAGVLAHDTGHVVNRDAAARLVEAYPRAYLVALTTGDIGGGTALSTVTDTFATSRNAPESETRADKEAVRLLNTAGISAKPLAGLFDRLTSSPMAAFPSHPISTNRAATLRAASEPSATVPILSAEQWLALKTICQPAEATPETPAAE